MDWERGTPSASHAWEYTSTEGAINGQPIPGIDHTHIGSAGLAIAMMANEPDNNAQPNCILRHDHLITATPIQQNTPLTTHYHKHYAPIRFAHSYTTRPDPHTDFPHINHILRKNKNTKTDMKTNLLKHIAILTTLQRPPRVAFPDIDPSTRETLHSHTIATLNSTSHAIRIQHSTIPGLQHEFGVIAITRIPKGTDICTYGGQPLTETAFQHRYPNDDATYVCDYHHTFADHGDPTTPFPYIDASDFRLADFGRWINSSSPLTQPHNVSRPRLTRGKLIFTTSQDIHPGQELLWDYGPAY